MPEADSQRLPHRRTEGSGQFAGETASLDTARPEILAFEMAEILEPLGLRSELQRERFTHALAKALDLTIDSIRDIVHENSPLHRARPDGERLHSSIATCANDLARLTIHETPNPEIFEVTIVGQHHGSRDEFTVQLLDEIATIIKNAEAAIEEKTPVARRCAKESPDLELAREYKQNYVENITGGADYQLRALMRVSPNQIQDFVKRCALRDVLQDELNYRFNDIVSRSVFEFNGQAARDFLDKHWRRLNPTPHPLAIWDTFRLSRQLAQIQSFDPIELRRGIFAFAKHTSSQPERARARIAVDLLTSLEELAADGAASPLGAP